MIDLNLSPMPARVAAVCVCLCVGSALAESASARQMPIDFVPPLLADDGTAYPAAQRVSTAEAAAGGRSPGWATSAQRRQLQRLHPHRVVRLHAADRNATVQRSPAADAWVFVDGHGEGAVRLARRLADAGVERVWVVLPERPAAHREAAGPARRSAP